MQNKRWGVWVLVGMLGLGAATGCGGSNCADSGTADDGGGNVSMGSCTDVNTGVCSQLTSGGIDEFRDSCGVDGIWSDDDCDVAAAYTCTGFTGTSNIDSTSFVIDIFWPEGFCEANPYTDIGSTCENNITGRGMGTACVPPT